MKCISNLLQSIIIQISCASGSPALSNRIRFRKYFQLQSNAELIAIGFYELIEVHGWRRVALIVQDESLFTVVCYWILWRTFKENGAS